MPKNAGSSPEQRGWFRPALIGVLAITVLRVILLAFNRTDLFVDEAQYWLWGQDLAFGYYSKPPLIGWVIRLSTELAGSDAPFWVRLPAPLFHGATALILGGIAARIFDRRTGIAVALGFVTLPMVALGSLLISTDTIMFPFLAAALAFYLSLLRRPSLGIAVLAGIALGLAVLAKYAAVYYLLCAGLAALILPSARPDLRSVMLILLAFLITISPNIVWNIANGFSTLEHTLDNADWVRDPGARAGLNLSGLAEFFAAQFAVIGPVPFAALLIAATRWRNLSPALRLFVVFSLPIVAVVCTQALLSKAYANWAASAYLAGVLCAVPWLMGKHRAWLIASFAINGALCVALPVATLFADSLRIGHGPLLLERYVERVEMSRRILDIAKAEGLDTIVAADRDILADLFYTGRDDEIAVFAVPAPGRAPHHYALKFPYPGGDDRVLYVARAESRVPCEDDATLVQRIAPDSGAYRRYPQAIYAVPGTCLAPRQPDRT